MLVEFDVFLYRSPKNIVHLSTNSGDAISESTSVSRLAGLGSLRKLVRASGEGMRPVRSSVTRRINLVSEQSGADSTPALAMRSNRMVSMKFFRGISSA